MTASSNLSPSDHDLFPPPALSAYEDGPEGFRLQRLRDTWEAILRSAAQLSRLERAAFFGAIRALHDHKGCLEVLWRDPQSWFAFQDLAAEAWLQQGEWNHRHECLDFQTSGTSRFAFN